ncbi:apicomplexan amino acid transporter ApiAT9, putative [Plasmodium yoelii]|uniref:Transporter, putative n=1 Tax=Plasmodium yoelii TaxID=5861 RepID=A0A078K5S4_PLAYE|nr:apicomplexan amino acid transporter ApiAT9, putative [Plasmodium yoelii]CDU16112.1 transporter, putative [Plasmodium yoelii]VTZ71737.1 apicomplexan amino acid transporter ApiAT9, putative [Plasmodium yoelii]|eukprot:XP_022811365.1 apicomplexan amino acid transporter ApiAT9, putative [Plasmodium yoelii]
MEKYTKEEIKTEKPLKNRFIKEVDIVNFSLKKKYCLLILFCLYITTCVGIFFNWISLSDFFYHGNVYIDQCNGISTRSNLKDGNNKPYSCEEQDKKVQALYPIIISSNFIMSAISGIFFDYFGPKITALIGHTFNIISWLLIGFQKEANNNIIIIGAIFLGLSCDSSYIPILNLIYLFPKNHTTYTVILGCCASLSFSIPIFFDLLSKGKDPEYFQYICFLYCFVILIPFFFIIAIFLPLKHINSPQLPLEIEKSSNTLKELEGYLVSENKNNDISKNPNEDGNMNKIYKTVKSDKSENINNIDKDNNLENQISRCSSKNSDKFIGTPLTPLNELVIKKRSSTISSDDVISLRGVKNEDNKIGYNNISLKMSDKIVGKLEKSEEDYQNDYIDEKKDNNSNILEIKNIIIDIDNNKKWKKFKFNLKNLLTEIIGVFFSLKYVSICYYFTIYNLSLVNYNECAKLFFKDYKDIQFILKLFGPLSILSCASFGILINKFHIILIIYFLLASSLFMYIFAIIKIKLFAYFSSFCYLIVTGCYTTQLYCYIQIMFPKCHFGKIAGTTSMISGLLSLLNIPIYNYFIVDLNKNNPEPFAYVVIAMLISTFPLLFLTYRRHINDNIQTLEG